MKEEGGRRGRDRKKEDREVLMTMVQWNPS